MSRVSAVPRDVIVDQARNRCGYYCLSQPLHVYSALEIEHIIPRARGGETIESNLWLACWYCNRYKGTQMHGFDRQTSCKVRLFNPRRQRWKRHFKFDKDDCTIIGLTACGRATVTAVAA